MKARNKAPTVGYRKILTALRTRILDGTFSAGQQLPTYVALEEEFHSSAQTVSRALALLQQHGFIRAEKRRGMFVTERPPHQHHYALAFEFPQDGNLSQFYKALRNEAGHFESAGRHFSTFYEIGVHTDTEDYQRLLGFVQSHRLAGVIFAQSPHCVLGTPLLDEPQVPRVAVHSALWRPDIPVVSPDLAAFIPRALDYLAARGRKRVAMFTAAVGTPSGQAEQFVRAVGERGMTCQPGWIQITHPHSVCWMHNIAQLMFRSSDRPDGLVLLDDNLVEHATAGIAASGVSVPQEVEVVAHTNFPWPTPSAVPVRRLGYDVRQLVELCAARVDALRRGEAPPPVTLLPALFEEELATNKTAAELGSPR